MKQDFQAGVDSIYNALVAAGATPSSKDPADLVSAITTNSGSLRFETIASNRGGHIAYDTNSAPTYYTGKAYKVLVVFCSDFSEGYAFEGSVEVYGGTAVATQWQGCGNEDPYSAATVIVYRDVPAGTTIRFRYSCMFSYLAVGAY